MSENNKLMHEQEQKKHKNMRGEHTGAQLHTPES